MKSVSGRTKPLDAYARSDRKCNDVAVHMPHPYTRWDAKHNRYRHHWCPGKLMPTVMHQPQTKMAFQGIPVSAPVPGDFVISTDGIGHMGDDMQLRKL